MQLLTSAITLASNDAQLLLKLSICVWCDCISCCSLLLPTDKVEYLVPCAAAAARGWLTARSAGCSCNALRITVVVLMLCPWLTSWQRSSSLHQQVVVCALHNRPHVTGSCTTQSTQHVYDTYPEFICWCAAIRARRANARSLGALMAPCLGPDNN